MNDVFDKLLIRILFTIFICISLLVYKYAHIIFYPSSKRQTLKPIYPSENHVDSLHIFSRLIGVAFIFSSLEFNEYIGISISTFHFFIWSFIGFSLYLLSIYITESIIFYNFEYKDEVLKKKNSAYGLVSFTNAICLALIVKTILKESENSLIILTILWLYSIVLYGFGIKLYKYYSKLSFNSLMIQKNVGLGFSYSGFILGNCIIILATFTHEHHDITSYLIQITLKILLGALIIPIFKIGVHKVFKIKTDTISQPTDENLHLGHGIYEGSVYITCALLTSIIIGQIYFGTIYPFF